MVPMVFKGVLCADGRYAGCGRFFEGTAEQMHQALNVILAKLPDDTLVYVSSPTLALDLQERRGTNVLRSPATSTQRPTSPSPSPSRRTRPPGSWGPSCRRTRSRRGSLRLGTRR